MIHWKRLFVGTLMIASLVLLVACTQEQNDSTVDGTAGNGRITEYHGKTAVITESVQVEKAYCLNEQVDEELPEIVFLEEAFYLEPNDIVLVIEEDADPVRIVLPYGDPPWIHGQIAKKVLRFDEESIQNGNQAVINNMVGYNQIDGEAVGLKNGHGQIVERKNGWACIRLPGGEDVFWVNETDLGFDFDSKVLDVNES